MPTHCTQLEYGVKPQPLLFLPDYFHFMSRSLKENIRMLQEKLDTGYSSARTALFFFLNDIRYIKILRRYRFDAARVLTQSPECFYRSKVAYLRHKPVTNLCQLESHTAAVVQNCKSTASSATSPCLLSQTAGCGDECLRWLEQLLLRLDSVAVSSRRA